MKRITTLLIIVLLLLALSACDSASAMPVDISTAIDEVKVVEEASTAETQEPTTVSTTPIPVVVEYDEDDLEANTDGGTTAAISLEGQTATVSGSGATVNGNIITITSGGTYEISGTLDDGRLIVDSEEKETVFLLFSGVDINSNSSAPVTINNADKVVITLAEGSQNLVSDATSYVYDDATAEEPNAALFSKDDLTINGAGTLVVEGNFNHGIASKDDLKITSGIITVKAVNDGLKGRDSIAILDGTLTIDAGGDGLQSNNDVDADKGNVVIEGGNLEISAGLDGIQAENSLLVSGGEISLVTGGGSSANYDFGQSAKGLKAGLVLTVSGGDITIDAADDALHSNGDITINGGQIALATADDGLHAEATLTINGGEVTILQSYEGLEAKDIVINDGIIHLTSSDDGINGSTGNGGEAMGGRAGGGGFMAADSQLTINGGYVAVDAWGDGLDVNGAITMTGGMVLVNGPTANNNGPVDYTGQFVISGGFLVAVGSAGMAQSPTESTTSQDSIMVNFDLVQAAGTLVHIQDQDANDLLTFAPTKEFQSLLLSSPELETGETYTVYTGGSMTGAESDSLYAGGEYTPGTEAYTVTTASAVTVVGSAAGGFFGGGPGGDRDGRRPPQ